MLDTMCKVAPITNVSVSGYIHYSDVQLTVNCFVDYKYRDNPVNEECGNFDTINNGKLIVNTKAKYFDSILTALQDAWEFRATSIDFCIDVLHLKASIASDGITVELGGYAEFVDDSEEEGKFNNELITNLNSYGYDVGMIRQLMGHKTYADLLTSIRDSGGLVIQ